MIFFKYIVLFLIFLICALIGNLISKKYKNRVIELKKFKEVYNILESKIKFTYEPIGDIFEEISNIIKEGQINKIFIEAKNNLNRYDLNHSWVMAIENNKSNLNLNKDDINTIKSFANMLRKDRCARAIK